MQVGSLVECLEDMDRYFEAASDLFSCNMPPPKKGDLEVIEFISKDGNFDLVGFYFTPLGPWYKKAEFGPKQWREVQPPINVSELIEETAPIVKHLEPELI